MTGFQSFVVFADMRTGSNFLEDNLNRFEGLSCLGEAFNPHFIGYPNQDSLLGMTLKEREKDPLDLLDRIKGHDGLAGFRCFHDHDARARQACLADPRCAKVILTRNPAESYVSLKIARATGQWKLTNVTHGRTQDVAFDADEFTAHLQRLQDFQRHLLATLQRSGQTAFYVDYEDLQDVAVMNGLAEWLGIPDRITRLSQKLKKQNAAAIEDKVRNADQMARTLARLDRFNLARTPNFEPRRGPQIPRYVAAAKAPLLFMPLASGPEAEVHAWMAGLDKVAATELLRDFTQKSLRDWMRQAPGHRSFAVLRHPVARAHTAFCTRILPGGPGTFPEIRKTLQRVHRVPLPEPGATPEEDTAYSFADHRAAFLGFLKFLKNNLQAQTAVRVDAAWASQLTLLQGMTGFAPPDYLLREQNLRIDLALLASQIGYTKMPEAPTVGGVLHDRLSAIYDAEVEAQARAAYADDYMAFGFGDWRTP